MANYEEVRAKLANAQLNKLKSVGKGITRTTLRLTMKKFHGKELPHGLFSTTRQKTSIRNTFTNSMSTYIKLSKA